MRRKPDIKYSKTEAISNACRRFSKILEKCRPSPNRRQWLQHMHDSSGEENQQVVAAFLADHPGEQMPLARRTAGSQAVQEDMLTIYPQDFYDRWLFISCLRKK